MDINIFVAIIFFAMIGVFIMVGTTSGAELKTQSIGAVSLTWINELGILKWIAATATAVLVVFVVLFWGVLV